jgi:hypothetical protein
MSNAAELEAEAEAARARLSETADEIRARMTPGQLMDEVMSQFRDGDGSQMLANLRTQARDNPMALALVGSGLAWLMLGSSPSADRATMDRTAGFPASAPAAGSSAFAGSRATGFGNASDDGGPGFAQGAADALASARDSMGDGVSTAGDALGRVAHDLRDAGKDRLRDVRQGASDLGQQARQSLMDVLDREPLVIGALGVAVGAAIGALLPATEFEKEQIGPSTEALREKADALLDRGVTAARDAASEIYKSARSEADRQGLAPGDETTVAAKVDAVVRAAGDAAGAIAERHVSGEPKASEAGDIRRA